MKLLFLIPIALFFVIFPAYGQFLSDATGLVNRFDVKTDGQSFEIETVSNFDIVDFEFDKNEKRLSFVINSGLEHNLGEVIIPRNLLGGNFTFYLNDQEFFPKINTNTKISFVTLNFTGSGENKLEIIGTTYLDGSVVLDDVISKEPVQQKQDTLFDSFELLAFVVLSIIIAIFIIVKMVKINRRNKDV